MQHESTSVSKPIRRKRSNAKARSGKPNHPLNGKMDAQPLRDIETMDTKSLYHLAMKDKEVAKMAEARLSETLVNARRILGLPHNYPAEKIFSYLDHHNQYRSYDTNGIRIDGRNWSKGKCTIIRNTTANTSYDGVKTVNFIELEGQLELSGMTMVEEIWYQNGKLHRLDGPAVASWHDNGKSAREEWYQNDKCHRLDGAAKIYWYDNGICIREEWYQNDKLHRDGAAAIIVWTNEGIKDEEKWYKNGKLHRVGDAAVTTWNNGILFEQKWFQNDKLHRLDGPAVINGWTPGGKWYIEGKEYSAADFIPALRTYIYRPKWKKSFKLITPVTYLDKVSKRAEPGSMKWAYMMGQFQQSHGVGLPKELKNNCMNAGYYAYALVGDSTQPEEVLMEYTKDHLYYIASGMGLHVTKDMNKSELCSLISSATN